MYTTKQRLLELIARLLAEDVCDSQVMLRTRAQRMPPWHTLCATGCASPWCRVLPWSVAAVLYATGGLFNTSGTACM